jgi:hypothetical protein
VGSFTKLKLNNMEKEKVIDYLKTLNIDELGEVLIEVGGFRNAEVGKKTVEYDNNIELYYDEYKDVDYCDVFIFPRQNTFLIWSKEKEKVEMVVSQEDMDIIKKYLIK